VIVQVFQSRGICKNTQHPSPFHKTRVFGTEQSLMSGLVNCGLKSVSDGVPMLESSVSFGVIKQTPTVKLITIGVLFDAIGGIR
jgi:hypothetical protein